MSLEVRCSKHPRYQAKQAPRQRKLPRRQTKDGTVYVKRDGIRWVSARKNEKQYGRPCDTCMLIWELKSGGVLQSALDDSTLEAVPEEGAA